jgi:DNA-binding Xre family transcriptional regulator
MVDKSMREDRKITNKVASEESGIPPATYSRLAANKKDFFISSKTFSKLVKYFELEPCALFKAVDE